MNFTPEMEQRFGTETLSADFRRITRRVARESVVLLKNDKDILPLSKMNRIAFFGRMQDHYLKGGTGSGNNACPPVQSIRAALLEAGANLDGELTALYDAFTAEHPYDYATGWRNPRCQTEYVIPDGQVEAAAARCDTALFVITRISGEDYDQLPEMGSYYLNEDEKTVLRRIRRHFRRVVVLLNTSAVIDASELSRNADGVVCLWQGGGDGASAAADVLLGNVCPEGCLPDTFAATLDGYPAGGFGETDSIVYTEDHYVGYRYFNTFAPEKVLFPFGFGLSYTDFAVHLTSHRVTEHGYALTFSVTNAGKMAGRKTVQVYLSYPDGSEAPARVLCGFGKSPLLAPGETGSVTVEADLRNVTLYDETVGGYYLPAGLYTFAVGHSLAAEPVWQVRRESFFRADKPVLLQSQPFRRLTRHGMEDAPTADVRPVCTVPDELPRVDRKITLTEVADGRATLDALIGSLSDEELACLAKGEGMCSPKGAPGNASVFGGVTEALADREIPVVSTTDGPAGIRLSSDVQTTSMPDGTAIAATFDPELIREMYAEEALEVLAFGCHVLLGPGTNIHRSPLCGRNFEYYSEDPLLSGVMASAAVAGLRSRGVDGVVKHFMANNKEDCRVTSNSVISERAIREIYGRPYEIAVRNGCRAIMTSYNRVGDRWAANNEQLALLLRDSYGFDGLVMTDWWANLGGLGTEKNQTDFAAMVKAQNDLYMVVPDALTHGDNLAVVLADGSLPRGVLQRTVKHVLQFILGSSSFAYQQKHGVKKPGDLGRLIDGKTPVAILPVTDGKAELPWDRAERFVAAITFVSRSHCPEQAKIRLIHSDKGAGIFAVPAGETTELREIALMNRVNHFVFVSSLPEAEATEIRLYHI